ncbi:MAG: hypothetical protein LBG46_02925 [Elusimicrobiota bacterium]|jgi:hypothetical protein|nr:hypothetical protein [Elusimicrobiota bacterium]
MLGIILRILIVMVVFLSGVLFGNIFMPKKQLEHTSIINIGEPKTSLNLKRELDIETALNALIQSEKALANTATEQNPHADTVKKVLLLQFYKAAKADYELEILKTQNPAHNRDGFTKIRDNYLKIKKQIETIFPLEKKDTAQSISLYENTKEELEELPISDNDLPDVKTAVKP